MLRRMWIPGLAGALVSASLIPPLSAVPAASAAAGSVQEWTTAGTYSYTPPEGVNGALVIATGGSGAGTWTGVSPSPGSPGGGGAIVTGYVPVAQPQGTWTVYVGGGGVPGPFSDSGPTAAGGGGSSGVYPGATALSVIAGGGGGAGAARSTTSALGPGGSGGNPDGSGQAGTGTDAGDGGADGVGGAGQGDLAGKGSSGSDGNGGAGGSGCCGGAGGSGPTDGGSGGSAGDTQLGGGGGGGYGGGASGGAWSLLNNYGGGGGAGGSFGPSLPGGFPAAVYESAGTSYDGADGGVLIATVAPAMDVSAQAVANGSVGISWQEPAQYAGFNVSYQALVNGEPVLSAPGVVDGLDPDTAATVTVLATAGALTALTEPVSVVPAVVPTISGLTPSAGSTAGGYPVTIQGSGFLAPTAVTINGNEATDTQVLSDGMITATVPGGTAGPAVLRVTNSGTGLSASASGIFSYFVPGPPMVAPAIASVAIAGDPVVGGDLVTQTTSSGDPAPTSAYEWASGPSGSGPWNPIPGATAAGFVPGNSEMGQFLRVTVTATNGVNPPAVSSAVTAVAVAGLKARVGDVGVSGTAQVGTRLTAVAHGVDGDPVPTLSYQWQVRTASGWAGIAGADAIHFTPTAAQVDQQVRVTVTADNGVGSAAASTSPPTRPVRGTTPELGHISVTGSAQVGGTLTAQASGIAGIPAPRLRYEWQQGGGGAGSWSDIPGQDTASLRVPASAAGGSVRVVVKAFNGVDPRAWAISGPEAVPAVPVGIGKVVVAGKAQIEKTLTADARDVVGDPAPALSYRWQRRSGKSAKWRSIRGADGLTVKVSRAWYRDRLRVRVTASSAGFGQSVKVSAATPKLRSARPQLDAVTPRRGSSAGATKVRIRGAGFMPSPRVRIGGARCRVKSLTRTRITCRTSPRRPGRVAIIVRNSDGRDAVLPRSFRYTVRR